jgi:putative toxin-antitoxin system antitoxin component (TIGR02293 family)
MSKPVNFIKGVTYRAIDDKNVMSLIEQVRKGVSSTDFYSYILDSISFTLSEWAHFLHLSERTMQRYRTEEKAFEPIHSEKIIELTMLYNYGVSVFGDKESFDLWLGTRNVALGNIAPKELLDTSYGIQVIKDELTRIEHGILA